MKFTEGMVGKRVLEISTGDKGVIVRSVPSREDFAYVRWDSDGLELWIELNKVAFIDPEPEEITINGIRYKLVRIED